MNPYSPSSSKVTSSAEPLLTSAWMRSPCYTPPWRLKVRALKSTCPGSNLSLTVYYLWTEPWITCVNLSVSPFLQHCSDEEQLRACVCVKLLQLCLTLCNPMDCSPPGSSVHGLFQARTLEWAAMPSSRGSFWPRDGNCISWNSCIAGRFFTAEPPGKPWGSVTSSN